MATRPRIRDAIAAAAAGEAPPVPSDRRKLAPSHTSWSGDTVPVAIIGAGAAGLAAAIAAAEQQRGGVVLLEGSRHIGTKILVSGGTRCNVTHDHVDARDFAGPTAPIRHIFAAFGQADAVRWFADMGVTLHREESGKLFPSTDSAVTVLNALIQRCNELGVVILADHRVTAIDPLGDGQGFRLRHTRGSLRAGRLIMATGGKSLPKSGSDGLGWDILQRLGHSVTPTVPALVPLVLDSGFFHAELSGLTHDITFTVTAGKKRLARLRNSLLWTHFGISGPAAMNISRHYLLAEHLGDAPRLTANLADDLDEAAIQQTFLDRAAREPRATVATALAEWLPNRFIHVLAAHLDVPVDTPLSQQRREHRVRLAQQLASLPIPVVGARGWNYAEVTAGGVPLGEVDRRTLESRHCPGLYLIGELLDVDGPIGGYNFQWAWSTGHLAGRAATT